MELNEKLTNNESTFTHHIKQKTSTNARLGSKANSELSQTFKTFKSEEY